ncbi:hypothetical protein [Streptomyces sp. NPDC051776]|uniref:hypothetical protein n=1 Tax=Streptomyces sp. NPDC051776 TaxID=3155414 RepID=UPI0034269FF8
MVPKRASISARLFLAATETGTSVSEGGPSGTSPGEGKNFVSPLARKKSSGTASWPRKTSSLK